MSADKKEIPSSRAKKQRTKKYEAPLVVNGTFMDVIKASVKDAKNREKRNRKKSSLRLLLN